MKVLILCLALSGCATCQNHPVACTIVGAVVAGSIVLAADRQNGSDHIMQQHRQLPFVHPIGN